MKIFDKNWVPTDEHKFWAERYILPLVYLSRLFTTWYIVLIWTFLLPFFIGESLLFCLGFALFSATISWYLWREPEEKDYYDN